MMKSDILVKRIYPKKALNNYQKKIDYLGSDNKLNINTILNIKMLLLALVFIIELLFSKYGYFMAPILVIVVDLAYNYFILDLPIKKRANIIEHESIFFFEVLSLSLQSNRNLVKCLEIASSSIDNELTKEVKIALKEVKLGKSLTEALNNLRNRIPSKSVDNVLLNVIEANNYGNSIVDTLNTQVKYITDKRILAIKGSINKMPTKVSIVSVLFFLPIIMLLVLAPVLITYFIK